VTERDTFADATFGSSQHSRVALREAMPVAVNNASPVRAHGITAAIVDWWNGSVIVDLIFALVHQYRHRSADPQPAREPQVRAKSAAANTSS
jgi:hypothetical protein